MADPEDPDSDLFRNAMSGVRRLDHDRAVSAPRRPAPTPRQLLRDNRRVMDDLADPDVDGLIMGSGDELSYRAHQVRPDILRRLRRGDFRIQDEIDLHGLNAPAARDRLARFLRRSAAQRLRCVRIVHGKGLRSPGRLPVLKPLIGTWLARSDRVLAYVTAPAHDGGTGALYVLLSDK